MLLSKERERSSLFAVLLAQHGVVKDKEGNTTGGGGEEEDLGVDSIVIIGTEVQHQQSASVFVVKGNAVLGVGWLVATVLSRKRVESVIQRERRGWQPRGQKSNAVRQSSGF